MNRKPLVLQVVEKTAKEIGAKLLVEPSLEEIGQITFSNGKSAFISSRNILINKSGPSRIAADKDWSTFFLKEFGYRVPEEKSFFSTNLCDRTGRVRNIDAGYEYAKELGFPVIIKPNGLSKGELVTKVYNKREYYFAARKIFNKCSIMLVQKYYSGRDFRITVCNNKVFAVYERIHLNIIGDGKSSVRELINKKQQGLYEEKRGVYIDIKDFRLINKLKRQGYNFDSVIEKDKKVRLLDNANLSAGGDVADYTEKVHPDFSKLALDISKQMDLNFCGIDIITEDIAGPVSKNNYVVLEINSSPGLENYSSMGEKQAERVRDLYKNIILSLEKGLF